MKTISEHKHPLNQTEDLMTTKSTKNILKKKKEREIIERFVRNPALNLSVISIDNSESPDFIVHTPDKKISIEKTDLYKPELKERESVCDSIIEKAESLFKEKYQDNLDVLITFIPKLRNYSKATIKSHATDIFEFVKKVCLANKQSDFNVFYNEDMLEKEDIVNKFISSIVISNEGLYPYWQTFGAYRVEHVDFNWLKEEIIKKEEKLKKYKNSFDENWLVLVANLGFKSSAHIFDYINRLDLKTDFEKVYIYKYRENSVLLLIK